MKVLVAILAVLLVCGMARATLIQDDFEDCTVGPGAPSDWREVYTGPGCAWEIVDTGGNKALKLTSGAPSGGGDAGAGPENYTGWYVENFEMQTSLCILSGRGGGLAIGQFDGQAYVGNSYFVEVAVDACGVDISEEGLSAGSNTMEAVYLPPGSVVYNQWYDLRMISTGTTFQVWFRPHTVGPWLPAEMIMEVPQDLLHPGHKSYVDGLAGCWAQNGGGPSTVLFDNVVLDAVPYPAPLDKTDDFEDSVLTEGSWSQHWSTLAFSPMGGSQVAGVTGTVRPGGIGLGLAKQYYTHNFVGGASMYVDTSTDGGIVWGWEGTQTDDWCYGIELRADSSWLRMDLVENTGNDSYNMAQHVEPFAGGAWYNIEVSADYERYYVYFWPRGSAKPATPTFNVAQDMMHPGYRQMNAGAFGLWADTGRTSFFDDFYFHGIEQPTENTSEGDDVVVEPEPGLTMTFDDVTEGGSTTVEVSDTAPGGGPGGLEFQGVFYDINTTCVYEGPITISFSYDDTGMTLEQEEALRLMHWLAMEHQWEDITQLPVDTANNIITGVASSLSVFAVAGLPVFNGFLPPINMPPQAMSVFKQKSTIPVKFRLLDSSGNPVPDLEAVISGQMVTNGVPGDVNETLTANQADSGNLFRYDADAGQYIFNLSTKNLSRGTYRIHAVTIGGLIDRWVDIAIK
ncbi:MAG TPA: PxKF domain-containing protein [Candidatus Bathyarchaeia archaeon]|nr:PxKF domain-containing protein [Candidatus Bathyarchaeia archaeon]